MIDRGQWLAIALSVLMVSSAGVAGIASFAGTAEASSVSVSWESTPPSTVQQDDTFTVSVSGNDGDTQSSVCLYELDPFVDDEIACRDTDGNGFFRESFTIDVDQFTANNDDGDNEYKFEVRVSHDHGLFGGSDSDETTEETVTVETDTSPPTVERWSAEADGRQIVVSATVTDDMSGVKRVEVVWDTGILDIGGESAQMNHVGGNSYEIELPPSGTFDWGEDVQVKIEATDHTGKTRTTDTREVTVEENRPPSISGFSASANGDRTVTVQASVSDDTGGIDEVVAIWDTGALDVGGTEHEMDLVGGNTYELTIPPSGTFDWEEDLEVKVRATDTIGESTESRTETVRVRQNEPPEISGFSASPNGDRTVTVRATVTDDTGSVDSVTAIWDTGLGDIGGTEREMDHVGGSTYELTIPPTGKFDWGEDLQVKVRAEDSAGEQRTSPIKTVTVKESDPPEISGFDVAPTGERTVEVRATVTDDTGIDRVEVIWDTGLGDFGGTSAPMTNVGGNEYRLRIPQSGTFDWGEDLQVKVEATDTTGKSTTTDIKTTRVNQNEPPSISGFTASPNGDRTVTVRATVTDDSGGVDSVTAIWDTGVLDVGGTEREMDPVGGSTYELTIPTTGRFDWGEDLQVKVRAEDSAGEQRTSPIKTVTVKESDPPEISGFDVAPTGERTVEVRATVTDDNGIDRVEVIWDTGLGDFGGTSAPMTNVGGNEYRLRIPQSGTFDWGEDLQVKVEATDTTGKSTTTDIKTTRVNQNEPPSISGFTASPNGDRTVTIRATVTDDSGVVDSATAIWDTGVLDVGGTEHEMNHVGGNTYELTIPPTGTFDYGEDLQVKIRAEDGAGGQQTTEIKTVRVERNDPPSISGFNFTVNPDRTVTVTATVSDTDGVDTVSAVWDRGLGDFTGTSSVMERVGGDEYRLRIPPSGRFDWGEDLQIKIEATDTIGSTRTSETKVVQVVADNTPPVINWTVSPNGDRTVTITATVTDTGSGVSADSIKATWDTGLGDIGGTTEPMRNMGDNKYQLTIPLDGRFNWGEDLQVKITATDNAGNSKITPIQTVSVKDQLSQVTIVGYDPQTGNYDNRTIRRVDETFPSAEASLPDDVSLSQYDLPALDYDKERIMMTDEYPWSAVGRYTNRLNHRNDELLTGGTCSAAVIEDNHILLAAHCVYDSDTGSWRHANPIFIPGQDGSTKPFSYINITFIQLLQHYVERGNTTHDIAVLTLERKVAHETGTMGYGWYTPDNDVYSNQAHLTGYPSADYANDHEQWDLAVDGEGTSISNIGIDSDCAGTDFCHDVDTGAEIGELTSPGQSGAPVWHERPDGLPEIISVMSQGSSSTLVDPIASSIAVRISEGKYSDIGQMVARGNELPLPPTAEANGPYTVQAGHSVELDSSGSNDQDGSLRDISWVIVDGPGSISDGIYRAPPAIDGERTATVMITVTDNSGETATDTAEITISPPGVLDANLVARPMTITEGEQVILDASGSSGPGERELGFEWETKQAPAGATPDLPVGATGELTLAKAGSYEFGVTVSTPDGDTDAATVTVTVRPSDGGPSASFDYSPERPQTSEQVTFDASGSDVSDGVIDRYAWDYDADGVTDAFGETVTTQFDSVGTKTVTLTVTDESGRSSTATRTVSVVAPPPEPDPITTDRSLGSTTVTPGDSTTITTSVTSRNATDRMTIAERFSPAFDSVSIDDITVVSGSARTLTRITGLDGLDVAIENIEAGTTVEVSYEVTIGSDVSDGRGFSVEGYVLASGKNVSIDGDTITVREGIARYANQNGVIDTDGLRQAISDWAFGEINTDRLREAISAWAMGSSVT